MAARPHHLALSIDLDAMDLYLGLYGLEDAAKGVSERAARLVPEKAAERFGELCAALGVEGTLFVVGRDLALGRGHEALRRLAKAGHEIASHSFQHDYALSRRTADEIDRDLAQAEEAIEALTGARPVGFRAPGYTLSGPLLERLAARGYLYDSSLLPSPPYYAAKAAVVGALKVLGKESRSILGPLGQLVRPRAPHRDRAGLLELPVSVLPGLRVPYIGTLLTTAPDALSQGLARLLARDELVVIELHGIDLLDASDGIPEPLLARQRDARVPATVKRRRIEGALKMLLRTREAGTLRRCAGLYGAPAAE